MSSNRTSPVFRLPITLLISILSISCLGSAGAQTTLEVETPWARATPPAARTGAVYLTLINRGAASDRLVAAKSPAAAQAELHAHINDGGVMRMKAVDAIVLAPGERLSLRPGGLHVMLVDLKAPLRDGARLSLTLTFAGAGEVTVEVPVLRNPLPASTDHRH